MTATILIAALGIVTAALLMRGRWADRRARVGVLVALIAGLGGYALAGRPQLPAGTPPPPARDPRTSAAFEEARQALLANYGDTAAWLSFADALVRQGRSADAVEGLEVALKAMPDNPELWVALGNVLTVHAEGQVTPAARLAFDRASVLAPDHPAPPYFLALAWVQAGEPDEAVKVLEPLLASAPPDAPWRPQAERLARGARAMAAAGVDGGRFPDAPASTTP